MIFERADLAADGGYMLKSDVIATIFVSQANGDDNCNGFVPFSDGCGNAPVRSIERAIEIIKKMRDSGIDNPLYISVVGDYFVSAPIAVKGVRVTVEPFGGKGRLIGGIRIESWQETKFNGTDCLCARLPQRNDGSAWDFTDLFVNGKRASVTRYPKVGELEIVNTEEYFGDGRSELPEHGMWGSSRWIIVNPEDLEPVQNIEDAIINYNHWWIDEHSPIESFERESGKLTMAYRSRFALSGRYGRSSSAAKYYLTNVPNMFSVPSEWYLDRKKGIVYYIPRDESERADTIEVFAPVVDKLFVIEGEDIRIRSFELTCTRGDYASTRLAAEQIGKFEEPYLFGSDEQSVCGAPGAILFENADRCGISSCSIHGVGVHAIEVGRGCRHIRIEDNEIYDISAGGVKIEGGEAGDEPRHMTSDNIIRHNHIHDCGKRYEAGCGILVMHSSNNEISENEVHSLAYSGISVGWVWGYAESSTYGNVIRANHIYNIGNGSLSDMGGIYTLGRQSGTVICENRIHNVKCSEYGAWGIYLDEGSSNITVESNIVWGTGKESMHIHWGTDNTVRNNIFFSDSSAAVTASIREWHHPSLFERNILVTDGKNILNGKPWDAAYHANIMYDISREAVMVIDEEQNCYGLDDWQKSYPQNCENTVRDPEIVNISEKNFVIKESSYVKALGFEDIVKKYGK